MQDKEIEDYPNYTISIDGVITNIKTNKKVSIGLHKHGHHVVRLWGNNKSKLLSLYRLLAINFIPNPDNKREVNHKDGNRLNYSLDNLEWVTPSENMKHAYNNGLCKGHFESGFNHKFVKLTKDNIIFIREKRDNKEMKLKELSQMFNVTIDHISRIANKKIWKEI
jgi:hypothetical protein